MENICHKDSIFKRGWSDCINIRWTRTQNKNSIKDKNGFYIKIKEWIHQKDVTIINVYALKCRASDYMKKN